MNTPAGGHSAATLYEASKLPCACDPGIKPAWQGARVAGPAFTVRGIGGDNLALHNAVLAAPAGSVLVADMQGRSTATGVKSWPSQPSTPASPA